MNLFKTLLMSLVVVSASAFADGTPDPAATQKLESEREAIPNILEQVIGSSYRPLVYDWRAQTALVDLHVNEIVEFNNFESSRYGLGVRFPVSGMLFGLEAARVVTKQTDSSDLIARTPYRQVSRPSRYEFEMSLQFPLAEGVVTQRFDFIRPADLVFSALLKARYLYYPGAGNGLTGVDVFQRHFTLILWESELRNMEEARLEGMRIDRARYNMLAGIRTDLFFRSGLFVYNETSLNIPRFFNDPNGLKWWWDFSFGLGYGF